MARDTDFLDLYKILGLTPDCELAEFKQAYRRRVLVLHPDRRAQSDSDLIAAERLQQLTTLYSAAMAFQRQHGRLPGAMHVRALRQVPAAVEPMAVVAPPRPAPPAARRLLVLTGVGVLGALLWSMLSSHPPTESADGLPIDGSPIASTAVTAAMPASAATRSSSPLMIHAGSSSDSVRHIEGDPLIISQDRWEYGPSWIRFEQGRVVEWYSSPVRPLRTLGNPPPHPLR